MIKLANKITFKQHFEDVVEPVYEEYQKAYTARLKDSKLYRRRIRMVVIELHHTIERTNNKQSYFFNLNQLGYSFKTIANWANAFKHHKTNNKHNSIESDSDIVLTDLCVGCRVGDSLSREFRAKEKDGGYSPVHYHIVQVYEYWLSQYKLTAGSF